MGTDIGLLYYLPWAGDGQEVITGDPDIHNPVAIGQRDSGKRLGHGPDLLPLETLIAGVLVHDIQERFPRQVATQILGEQLGSHVVVPYRR